MLGRLNTTFMNIDGQKCPFEGQNVPILSVKMRLSSVFKSMEVIFLTQLPIVWCFNQDERVF